MSHRQSPELQLSEAADVRAAWEDYLQREGLDGLQDDDFADEDMGGYTEVSLEAIAEDAQQGEVLLGDALGLTSAEEEFFAGLDKAHIASLIEKTLSPRQRLVYEARLAHDGPQMTLRELASHMGRSYQRVDEIGRMAVAKLRLAYCIQLIENKSEQ